MKEKVCVISQHDKNLIYTAVHFTDSQGWAVYAFQVYFTVAYQNKQPTFK